MPRRSAKSLSVDEDLGQLPVTHRQVITESYLDLMGHMNVSWYTHLFSSATLGTFLLMGMDKGYFKESQAGSFALESHIQYLAEVLVGKNVSIRSRLLGSSERFFHFMHFLINDDDHVLSATCEFVGAHMDLEKRRIAPMPPRIQKLTQQVCDEHAQLLWEPPVCGIMKASGG